MKKYILFGCGEQISNIFDIIHALDGKVYKVYQNMPEVRKERGVGLRERVALLGYDIRIYDSLGPFEPEEGCSYILGTTTPEKYKLVEILKKSYALTFSTLIHPTVLLGANVHVGEGVTIDVQTPIAPNAYLDDFCTINRCSTIGHETRIGKYTFISTGASIAGSTLIGEKCRIGMKATILEHLCIGDWTVIGAGSLVNKDLPQGVMAYGIPAKVVRKNVLKDVRPLKAETEKKTPSYPYPAGALVPYDHP